jgi:spermidine/putrescine transport system ATP-binding protein
MARPPSVEIRKLFRRFDRIVALDEVSLAVQPGEFFSLLGPSGCGKTTLLRIIAGLDMPDSGTVHLDGDEATQTPPHLRPVNTVFQSYALFPHLTVRDNVAFGLRMKKVRHGEVEVRVRQVMELVRIEELGARRPSQLSGGQKQRVALARAIVNEPRVLLLDEPLAALDLKLRKELQLELRNLQRRMRMTFIYVTHDQEEALTLSDRIALMRDGRIEQIDSPAALYEMPRTRFASQFLGSANLIEGRIRSSLSNVTVVETALGELRLTTPAPPRPHVTLAIRPEKIRLSGSKPADTENLIEVSVDEVIYAGAQSRYLLVAGSQRLQALIWTASGPEIRGTRLGCKAWAYFPPDALVVLED